MELGDLPGLYIALRGVPGKGSAKVLTAALGWACAELLLTRPLLLWVGARGAQFDWIYIQKCLQSNINLVNNIFSTDRWICAVERWPDIQKRWYILQDE